MSYEFFFSYTRADNDEFMRQFFEDLNDAVRILKGLPQGTQVGFFDQQGLQLGEQWDPALVTALQSSKTMVSLYSPGYFNSEYCGKEWQFFNLRRQQYVAERQAAGEANPLPPPVFKPVIWVPLPQGASAPAAVGGPQYTSGNPQAIHNTTGVRRLRKQYNRFQAEYEDFKDKLAEEIYQAANNFPLPQLQNVPLISQVQSAFHTASQQGGPPVPKPQTTGPKFVQFVFVAAHPNEFPQGIKSQLDCYLQDGGRDWKPYYPQKQRPIRALVENIASAEGLEFYSEELRFSANLAQDVRNALRDRKIVVLVVDSWTARLQPYSQVLEDFDQQNYINCCVLVPWNSSDADTAQKEKELREKIESVFHFRVTSKNTLHFRDSISSEEEFAKNLREVLERLKQEIINKAEVARPVPTGGEKPIITGPGA
jgi:FxsC-like protein